MARHPEITEKQIIEAGISIEKQGKTPNPGAIRAKLGFKGGLLRIRTIWDKHVAEQEDGLVSNNDTGISFDDLPSELYDAANDLIEKQKHHLENTVLHAYLRCQAIFEKRLNEQIKEYETRLNYFKEYELSVDESIEKLENKVSALQSQNIDLNDELRRLTVENSQLKGSIETYEKLLPKTSVKSSARPTRKTTA
ncbi:MAG: DNA-binding protein [Glaciecola sp.]|jgi:chromosome segregation ATPase